MANEVYKFYKDLPSWAKGVVVVGGIAIVYFTSKSILRRLKAEKDKKDSKELVKDVELEKRKLINSGMRASYTATQYKTWANSIQQAFDGCDASAEFTWGANSPLGTVSVWSGSGYKVANIFNQLKNNLDFLELLSAWGIRTYDACGYFTGDVEDVDLIRAITDELSSREISNLNKILAKKGISNKI